MRPYPIVGRALLPLAIALLAAACSNVVGPEKPVGLNVAVVFPKNGDDAPGARGKPAAPDTASAITRMDLTVATGDGASVLHRPFAKKDGQWQIEVPLPPAEGLTVTVNAWHKDALMYSGSDTSVTVEPGAVTTATVLLKSYRPVARLSLRPNNAGSFEVFADPRESTDPVSARDSLRVRYDWQDDGTWDTGDLTLVPQQHRYPGPGHYTVRARVANPAGLVSDAVVEVTIQAGAAHLSPSLVIAPSEGEPGTFFTADASASLTGLSRSDSVAFRWDWNGDGAWDTPWSKVPVAKVRLVETGTYRVRMQMRASGGRQAVAEGAVFVRGSSADPLVPQLMLTPLVVRINEPIIARVKATNGTASAYRWDWDGDGMWDTGWSADSTTEITYPTPGTRRVRVAVKSASGATATAAGEVAVNASRQLAAGQEMIVDGVSMRYVPPGRFAMGNRNMTVDEFPVHEVSLGGFLMDTYEVTNALYERFVRATGHPAPKGWIGGRYPAGQGDLPVVNVSWYDAEAYAAWRGARLPTEAEWEYAARGSDGRTYPWGNEMSEGRANYGPHPVKPVGQYPAGVSPFNIYDMAGNVWEWTADLYRPYPGFEDYTLVYPSAANARLDENRYLISGNPFLPERAAYRVMRGGSVGINFGTNGIELRASNREPQDPATGGRYIGFRCVVDVQ